MGWGEWTAIPLADLAQFSCDFDFHGKWRQDLDNYFHWDDRVAEIVDKSEAYGYSTSLRQLYPKGEGLKRALLELQRG